MAQKSRGKRSKKPEKTLPFTKKNYQIFGVGILVLVLGYLSMMKGPVDSFWSLTLAPILLVIGYVGIIPFAFLYNDKSGAPQKSSKQE